MKKFAILFLILAVGFSLCACGTEENAAEESIVEASTAESGESSNNEELINADESASTEYSTNIDESVNTEDAASVDESINTEESTNSNNSDSQNVNPIEKNVLYREDFEVPDCHNLGYTNLIDFYNDYPNGKAGGSTENASLIVHYPGNLDKFISDEESIAFKTYRGIGLGSSLKEVFDAYGTVALDPPNEWEVGISDAEHTLKQSAIYLGQIESGAYVTIRFYFDQNDTVMFIDYGAINAQYASEVDNNMDTYEIIMN